MHLPDKNSIIIGQGITGSEGRVAALWMQRYGTNLVAGVTPGKGGQTVEEIPIFNTVAEAVEKFKADWSVLYVPPLLTKKAALEAMEAGIKGLVIVAEKVPTYDGAILYAEAKKRGVTIIGPSSAGIINPSLRVKIGSIGGPDPEQVFVEGSIAVISKSGGMTAECSLLLKNNNFGVSWAICIGGDRIPGSDYVDILEYLELNEQTKTSVIFGELGGTLEEAVGKAINAGTIKKPVVAYIAGEFTQNLPLEVQFGHAGAIIEGERGRPDYKRRVLKESGVLVAEDFDAIAQLVQNFS